MDARSNKNSAAPEGCNIAYFTPKELDKSLKAAFMGGGRRQKIAMKAKAILRSLGDSNPFAIVPITNHGESRIRHCVKYDLGDGWRLIPQKTNKTCGFLRDHEDTDAWLGCMQFVGSPRIARIAAVRATGPTSLELNSRLVTTA